jgi:hypothetical protein
MRAMLHPARRSTDCWLIPARSANQSFEPLDRASIIILCGPFRTSA